MESELFVESIRFMALALFGVVLLNQDKLNKKVPEQVGGKHPQSQVDERQGGRVENC
jgi:hypothetical protein